MNMNQTLPNTTSSRRKDSRQPKKVNKNVVVTMENVTQDIYGDIWTEINRMQPKPPVFETRFDSDSMIAKFTTGNNEDAERLQKKF